MDRGGLKTLIIDEIQKAPELLNSIKVNVDNDNARSQYLLTGSANLHFVEAVKDSLAGRFATVRLRTLTMAEVNGRAPDFLERAFNGQFPAHNGEFSKNDVLHAAFTYGYPEQMELDGLKVKSRFTVLKSLTDSAGETKRIVIMSAGKPVCFLTGELLKGTSNPASFFAEYGADWVSANNGQQFSTFRIS